MSRYPLNRFVEFSPDDEMANFFNRKFGIRRSNALPEGIHISRDGLNTYTDSPEGTKRYQERLAIHISSSGTNLQENGGESPG